MTHEWPDGLSGSDLYKARDEAKFAHRYIIYSAVEAARMVGIEECSATFYSAKAEATQRAKKRDEKVAAIQAGRAAFLASIQ